MKLLTKTIREEGIYHGHLDGHGKLPMALFLPQAYEPKYPYPLLVFLHGHGESEKQWIDAVPEMSRRNYVCIGLRGPHPVLRSDGEVGYGWGRSRCSEAALEDYILSAIHQTMRSFHIHSERVYLAGSCEGASVAYRMGLSMPNSFAGVIALNGRLHGPLPPSNLRVRSSLNVFIGHSVPCKNVPVEESDKAYQLLRSLGIPVVRRLYNGDNQVSKRMLADVNRWLIGSFGYVT